MNLVPHGFFEVMEFKVGDVRGSQELGAARFLRGEVQGCGVRGSHELGAARFLRGDGVQELAVPASLGRCLRGDRHQRNVPRGGLPARA